LLDFISKNLYPLWYHSTEDVERHEIVITLFFSELFCTNGEILD